MQLVSPLDSFPPVQQPRPTVHLLHLAFAFDFKRHSHIADNRGVPASTWISAPYR